MTAEEFMGSERKDETAEAEELSEAAGKVGAEEFKEAEEEEENACLFDSSTHYLQVLGTKEVTIGNVPEVDIPSVITIRLGTVYNIINKK